MSRRFQFSLRTIFALTTAVASLLGILGLLPEEPDSVAGNLAFAAVAIFIVIPAAIFVIGLAFWAAVMSVYTFFEWAGRLILRR